MDPPVLVKTIKCNPSPLSSSSSQDAMFSIPKTLTHYRPFAQSDSAIENLSFNSYVKTKTKDLSQKSPENNTNCTIDDTEISIFDAQKYFSETDHHKEVKRQDQGMIPHDMLSVPRLSSVSSADGYRRNFRTRSFHARPTASTESSWNSQTGLLMIPPGSMEVSMKNNDSKRTSSASAARKWIFGRRGCCTGKKSVQVKEAGSVSDHANGSAMITSENHNSSPSSYSYTKRNSSKSIVTPSNLFQRSNSITSDILEIQQHKIMPPNPLRLSPENNVDSPRQPRMSISGMAFGDAPGGFSFPILNPSSQTTERVIIRKPVINPLKDPPRDSLEVFQPIYERQSVSNLPFLDNPLNARPNFTPGSPITRDDDMCSDASSELFEIESFSTQTTLYPTYHRRDSLDEAFAIKSGDGAHFGRRSVDDPPESSVAATECYAPSEVSIDWSVTTAEGFDRASISNFSLSASELGQPVGDGGKKKGSGGLLLMSCRHEKAVSVGPQPVKCEGAGMLPVQVGGGRPPRANKAAMGSAHAARLSVAFAA